MANDVAITISAKNLTEESFRAVKQALKDVKQETQRTSDEGGRANAKFKLSFSDISGGVSVAAGAVAGLSAGLIALGSGGADVGDVRDHFRGLTGAIGESADAMLGGLRDATFGTISDFDLMKAANAALSQGLKVSATDMRTVGDVAAVLADRVGGDTKEAYDLLTAAMASGRDQQLKQIGLNIDAEAAIAAHASAQGKLAKELTEAEKRQAVANAILTEGRRILEQSGKAQADFGDQIAQSKAKLSNWVHGIGEWVATTPAIERFASTVTVASGAVSATTAVLGPLRGAVRAVIPDLGAFTGGASRLAGVLAGSAGLIAALGGLAVAWTFLKTREIRQDSEAISEATRMLGKAIGNAKDAREILDAFATGQAGGKFAEGVRVTLDMAAAYEKGRASVGQLRSELGATTITLEGFGAAGQRNTALTQEQIEAQRKYREQVRKLVEELSGDGAVHQARLYGDAIKQIGGVSKLTVDEKEALVAVLDRCIEKFGSLKAAGLGSLQAIYLEALRLNDESLWDFFGGKLPGVDVGMPRIPNVPLPKIPVTPGLPGMPGVNVGFPTIPDIGLFDGLKRTLQTQLGDVLLQALTGGGNPAKAAGGLVGQEIGKNIAGMSGEWLTKHLGSTLGGAIGSVIPGLGTVLGSLAGEMLGKVAGLFKKESMKVNDARDEFLLQFGAGGLGQDSGFHTLARQLHELGAEGDALFQRVINAKKMDEFRAAADAATAALARQEQQVRANAERQAAHQAEVDAVTAKYQAMADKLRSEIKSINDQVAQLDATEAWEEEMGVVERQTRDRLARQKEDLQRQLDATEAEGKATVDALNDAFQAGAAGMIDAAREIRDAIRSIPTDVQVRVRSFRDPDEDLGPLEQDFGAFIRDDRLARGAVRQARGSGVLHLTIPVVVDGREVARANVRHERRELRRLGVAV